MSHQRAATYKLDEQQLHLKKSATGHTVEVPAKTFLAHYTNLLHSQRDTDDLVSHVKKGLKTGRKTLSRNGWTATNVIGPNEDSPFLGLEGIAEEIYSQCMTWNQANHHPKLQQRTTRLICRPNHTTASEARGGSMRTDAQFILLKEDSQGDGNLTDVDPNHVPTSAAVAPAEFKTQFTTENCIDNEGKLVLGAVGHILYADPCRRSVIAFTIEDELMRFWYFSRSHIAVSAAFDYHANPRLFIRFVIFMTFASLEELGYDPTVKRVRVGENIQYRFTIGDKVYQTTEIIYEMNLDIVTRATRVWEVVELDANYQPTGTHKVLKDVWLYFDATPESKIYEAIFRALRQLDEDGSIPENERPPPVRPGSSLAEDAKHYFMTIFSDSVVTINGQPDEAHEPPEGYVEFLYAEAEDEVAFEATVEGTQRGQVEACTLRLKRSERPTFPHKTRVHRRIVFEEVCRTLYNVVSYAEFTKGVAQLVYGLEYMRLAGFVHRDSISPGNCLFFMGQIKISDLEYARPYAVPGHGAAPLTGTPGFMAVESQSGSHLFKPQPPPLHIFPGESPPPTPPSWFKYNFLHDLESVLWIYLWFLLETLPEAFTPAQIKQHCGRILRLNHMLFDSSVEISAQRVFFMQHCARSAYGEVVEALTEVYGVDSKLPKALEAFRSLSSCYRIVEASTPLLVESPQATHWDRQVFMHKFYQAIYIYLMDAHEEMKGRSDKAKWLSDSLREAKQAREAAQRAERRRSNKRRRMCEDNEACVPHVRPDEVDSEDSASNMPPSPTEETQVSQNKRKRA